jgi:hypothetical protein
MHLIAGCGIELTPQPIELVIAGSAGWVRLDLVINHRPISLGLDDPNADSGCQRAAITRADSLPGNQLSAA